jgi:hypothetical protein
VSVVVARGVERTVGGRRGDRMFVVHARRLGITARVHVRAVAVTTVLCGAAVGVFAWSLTVGDFRIAMSDELAT